MNKQERRGVSSSTRVAGGYGAVLVLLCVAMPAGFAHAQEVTMTGSVTCEQVVPQEDIMTNALETVTYSVSMDLGANLVVGRWGEGRDVTYQLQIGVMAFTKKSTTQTAYFYSISDPNVEFEQLYSETGLWEARLDTSKSRVYLTGTSFVVSDTGGLTLAAQCSWTLQGVLPPL